MADKKKPKVKRPENSTKGKIVPLSQVIDLIGTQEPGRNATLG